MKKGEATRLRIIEGAKKLYKEYGYTNTSMQMIADEAGISKSLLTYYFAQKSDIMLTVMRNFMVTVRAFVSGEAYGEDALLTYFLTFTIIYKSIFADKESKAFYMNLMTHSDERGLGSYGNTDELYLPIIEQYNINVSEKEYTYVKIMIMGAHAELARVYCNGVYPLSEDDYIQQMLLSACRLLGIGEYLYKNCSARANEIIATVDCGKLHLLD